MMESLKEDLATLSDTVPLLTTGVANAVREAAALEVAAQDLLDQVAEAAQDSGGHLAKLRDALPSLAVQAETHEKSVSTAGDEAKTAWVEARAGLGEAEQRLQGELEDVLDARLEMARALAEAGTRIDQSTAAGDDAIARLQHVAEDAAARLNAASQALTDEVAQLRDLLDTARTDLSAASSALWGRLEALYPEVTGDVQQILEALTQRRAEHRGTVRGHLQDLEEHVHQGVNDIGEKGKRIVTGPVAAAALELCTALQALAGRSQTHEETLREQGKSFEQAFTELETEARRVPAGLHQIEAAIQQLRKR